MTNIRFVLSMLFLGAASSASTALAQSRGTFATTGDMITARAGHTATLLFSGKVLIAGGVGPNLSDVLASAELYDPSTGTFTVTGNMTTGRAYHTATLLPNGRVLIAGGWPASAEVYDPDTGTFVATDVPPRPQIVFRHTSNLLANGTVLLAANPHIVYRMEMPLLFEIYDPASDTFAASVYYTRVNPMLGGTTGTLLPDGRVFITGCDSYCEAGATALYDPGTGKFSPTDATGGPMGWWYNVNTATLLMNGRVLIVGSNEDLRPADAEVYDPSTGKITGIGNTAGPHEFSTATLLPDGTVLIAGSQMAGGNGDPVADLYAPATGTFNFAGNMTTGRQAHTATLLPDGKVLIAGGASTSSAEIYKPPLLQAGPELFSLSGGGRGQGAIWHALTGQVASPGTPAVAGEALSMYTTSLRDGSVIPPQVFIGGRMAEILFFGNAPGYPGFNQVNFRVPSGVARGPAVPVRLTYLGRPSNEVTIGVQ
jgi:hypothetical protein